MTADGPLPAEEEEDGDLAAEQEHLHGWVILAARKADTVLPFAQPQTIVLGRCRGCGEPRTWLLAGVWTTVDLKF